MYRANTALTTSSTTVDASTIATKPSTDWQTGDMIMDLNGLGFAVTANTSISATTIPIGYRFTLKGATGEKGEKGDTSTDVYTKSEINSKFVLKTGDIMDGNLTLPNLNATTKVAIASWDIAKDSSNNLTFTYGG